MAGLAAFACGIAAGSIPYVDPSRTDNYADLFA